MINIKLASFGKRFLAFIIDFIIVVTLTLVLMVIILKPFGGIFGVIGLENFEFGEDLVKGFFAIFMAALSAAGVILLAFPLCLIIGFFYDFLMISFSNQATFGKKVMKIKVLKEDGTPLNMFEVIIRTVVKFVTGFVFVFLWLICLFTKQSQTLHDKVIHSLVINEE